MRRCAMATAVRHERITVCKIQDIRVGPRSRTFIPFNHVKEDGK